MAFVNEYVSEEDVKKYDLESIWKKVKGSTPFKYIWTVDHERNVFLFSYQRGREEFANRIDFVLSWDGVIHTLRLTVEHDQSNGVENTETTWRMQRLNYADGVHGKDEIIDVLKEALRAYKVNGLEWPYVHHTAIFEF